MMMVWVGVRQMEYPVTKQSQNCNRYNVNISSDQPLRLENYPMTTVIAPPISQIKLAPGSAMTISGMT